MEIKQFQQAILEGIPEKLPNPKSYDPSINHAPKRKAILSSDEKKLALQNALRYFKPEHHAELAKEFLTELSRVLKQEGKIIIEDGHQPRSETIKKIEEPELEKRLRQKYLDYKKKTPMFIPNLSEILNSKQKHSDH